MSVGGRKISNLRYADDTTLLASTRDITIGGCKVVESYVYLGSTITNTGGCEDETRRRCAVTRSSVEKLTKIWKDRKITKNTKIRLMRCLVFPIFLYGTET
ncbi:unnamed protein product [Euphydryas editha]|uniref:Reverse transcriptase domain-containing protein n=1 Tax=Euphydryas editha TaxID=104508 RepID=A0AAU9TH79_EUPED|nr:unnamed protein product [Euphydryas editha]